MVEMRSVNFATGYIYIYIYEEEEMVVGRGGGGNRTGWSRDFLLFRMCRFSVSLAIHHQIHCHLNDMSKLVR